MRYDPQTDGYERHKCMKNANYVIVRICNSTCRAPQLPGVLYQYRVSFSPGLPRIIATFLCLSRRTAELAPRQKDLNAMVARAP